MTPVTWECARHGKAPWMQFFYDWRFADLDGDGQIDFILTGGAQRQIAYPQDGRVLWAYQDQTAGFMDIRLDSNLPVADINADGVPELVCARKVGGALHLCLFGEGGYSLRDYLQQDDQISELQEKILQLMNFKRETHFLHQGDSGATPHLASIG